jgi:drug/metabolite transporter superfamily protein YnfA
MLRSAVGNESLMPNEVRVLPKFWQFLREEKKYWLVPIGVVFVLFALLLLMVLSYSNPVAPL